MVLIRAISIVRGILLFIAQMLGAIVAAYVVQALFTGKLNVSTTLSPTTTIAQGVIIEMLLTSQLVFTIFMLAAEKHVGNFIAPLGIGLSLFIAELTGKLNTSFAMNQNKTNIALPRCLLDRRISQSRTLLRSSSRSKHIPNRTMGLLGRATLRILPGRSHLHHHQGPRIRDRKP